MVTGTTINNVNRPHTGGQPEQVERNALICQLKRQGKTERELAAIFRLRQQRIHAILSRERQRRSGSATRHVPPDKGGDSETVVEVTT